MILESNINGHPDIIIQYNEQKISDIRNVYETFHKESQQTPSQTKSPYQQAQLALRTSQIQTLTTRYLENAAKYSFRRNSGSPFLDLKVQHWQSSCLY